MVRGRKGARRCECADKGCPVHEGASECKAPAIEAREEEEREDEPCEGDITTEDHLLFMQYGKTYLEVPASEEERDPGAAMRALRAKMDSDKFWPDVWFISDHGNAHRIDMSERV